MFTDKWNERFLKLAREVSKWSKDPSTKVGAVIVRPDRTIASLGYNGFPRGVEDIEGMLSDRDVRLYRSVHAEMNAILSNRDPDLSRHTMFVWPFSPCADCAKAIIQSGIRAVVVPERDMSENGANERWEESLRHTVDMFNMAGVGLYTVDVGA